ncbi:hypothetical protein AMECASPLE_002873 [Ameca splendens]|uniref:Uncharacterized protein n=1 Tax=Ameca splendens TaxID=208324 RepID=A0ABV1A4N7_9TELE
MVGRLEGGGSTVRQLLAFQKRLSPGSTINNELILSACGQRNTPHLFWNNQVLFKPHTKVTHTPRKIKLGKQPDRTIKSSFCSKSIDTSPETFYYYCDFSSV